MIELTAEQALAMEQQEGPIQVLNPRTKEVFVLIRNDVYNLTCSIIGGQGKAWNDPADDDLIRKPA